MSESLLTLLQIVVYGLTDGAGIALMALGVTVVFGLVRILNMAQGDVFALSSVLCTVIIFELEITPESSWSALIGALIACAIGSALLGALLNVLVERLAFAPFRGASRLAPLIATLGLSFVMYQIALLWRVVLPGFLQADHRSVPGLPEVPVSSIPELIPSVNLLELAGVVEPPLVIDAKSVALWLIAIGLALFTLFVLYRTRFGAELRAVAQQPDLARLCGINVERAISRTFAFGGFLSGIAAFVFVLHYSRPFGQHGAESGLIALAAAVLGGVGNPIGALIAGFGIGVTRSLSDFYLSTAYTPALVFSLLIALLALRPASAAAADERLAPIRDAVTVLYRGSGQRRTRILWGALLACAVAYPLIDSALGIARVSTFTVVLIFVTLAIGLTLMLGFAGMLDLGYAVSFGVGAYAAGLLLDPYGAVRAALGLRTQPDLALVLLIAGVAAGLFGLFNAALTFRMRAEDLALVTLAFGLILRQLLLIFPEWTGGRQGISALPTPVLFGVPLSTPESRYWLALAVAALCAFFVMRLAASRSGRAFMAMGEDEQAAAASGVHVNHYKGLAFVLGAAIAGIAGAAYIANINYVDPELAEFRVSLMVLTMVIVFGAGSVPGAIAGAVLIAGFDRIAIPALGDWLAKLSNGAFDIRQLSYLTYGLAIYLAILARAKRTMSSRVVDRRDATLDDRRLVAKQ